MEEKVAAKTKAADGYVKPDPSVVRAKLEFPVWYGGFAKAYTAWTNAPNDLKTPLLLQGPALAKAESWLLDFPDKLTESEKRFIVRSISQRTREAPARASSPAAKKGTQSGWQWRGIAGHNLWPLYAVVAVCVWFFSPDVIRDLMERALNPADAYKDLRQQQASKGQPKSPSSPLAGLTEAEPKPQQTAQAQTGQPDEGAESSDPPARPSAAQPEPVEAPPARRPAPPPPRSLPERLADLAKERLDAGQQRVSLLLSIEAGEEALAQSPVDSGTIARAANVLARAMATREALGQLAPQSTIARTALFCEDARSLIGVAADESIAVWSASGVKRTASLPLTARHLEGAATDRECRRFLAQNDDFNLEVRSLSGGKAALELRGHEAAILASSFSPDGSAIVTASQDSTARLWDARTGRAKAVLSGHDWHVVGAEFSPDGRKVITSSSDMTARIWDSTTGRETVALRGHQGVVSSARFIADGARVLTTSWDGFARVWDTASGKALYELGYQDGIQRAEASRDGQTIATTISDGSLQLWDAGSGKVRHMLPGEGAGARSMLFTPNGRWLSVLSWNGKVTLYDVENGTLAQTFASPEQGVRSIQLGPSGGTLVAITEAGIRHTWPIWGTPAEAMAHAKSMAPACLNVDERASLGLEGPPPAWCSTTRMRDAALP